MRNGFVMESFGYLKIMKYGNYNNKYVFFRSILAMVGRSLGIKT